jgi:hypothetical protein
MAKQQIDTKTIVTIGAVGLGIYILYKPIKALFDTFGITQSETAQAVTTLQTSGAKSPFSPLYWRSIKRAHLLTMAQADAKAKAIFDSINYTAVKPDYNKILAIFKTLTYKTQVSFLAEQFQKLYKQDLLEYLRNGKSNFLVHNALSENQVQTILDLVSKLK